MGFGRPFYEPIFKLIQLEKLSGDALTLGVVKDQYVPADILRKFAFKDFGEESVEFSEAIKVSGFNKLSYLDVSDYEGAEIIQDLSEKLEPEHHAIADLVLDNGTIEHCANPLRAIENVLGMLRENGVAVFMSPSNGYLDHGFWQICPTLYFDLFHDLGFEILFLYLRASNWDNHDKLAFDYKGIKYHSSQRRLSAVFPRALTFCAVRKTKSFDQIMHPIQSFYSARHEPRQMRDFSKIKYPASLVAGTTTINNLDLVGPANFVE